MLECGSCGTSLIIRNLTVINFEMLMLSELRHVGAEGYYLGGSCHMCAYGFALNLLIVIVKAATLHLA